MKKQMTLCVVRQGDKVLLGMKKCGFGMGRWNPLVGKVDPGETIEQAARREIKEEAGVEVKDLDKVGFIDFEFQDKPGILKVNIFRSTDFIGEPVESEEMKPQWFGLDQIPFAQMWPDDLHWFPLFLAGRFLFGEGEGNTIVEQELNEIEKI